ncbi:MAG: glutamate-1-semialdehyde 2,1-aminomutase [Candidatus Bathyarchaeia archaeon]
MKVDASRALYEQASMVLVGGVNSPVRAFTAVGGTPRFIKRARGSKIQDVDGNSYIDYVCSWGALILGSANPMVVRALRAALPRGTSYGAPTQLETELADLVISSFPSIEKLRFVNSGTEAVMSALRVARAYTKRNRILKFEGCYHGHSDAMLVKGGSGMATFGIPDSAGVTAGATSDTIVAHYNDPHPVKTIFEEHGDEIAAVIVEPIAANMGLVPPKSDYLRDLREITRKYGALLIFDEVVTGFRASLGGAQKLYGVQPDLTCLGKIIGGGLPVGAYGGSRKIMDLVAPTGPVYQAGTLSGNPLAMTAGIVTLREIKRRGFYEKLERTSARLERGLREAAKETDCDVCLNRVGSMLGLFFTDIDVKDYSSAKSSDTSAYKLIFNSMLEHGVYLPPSPFETIFVSAAHSQRDVTKTIDAAKRAFQQLRPRSVVSKDGTSIH